MVKIITALEARVILSVLESNIEILEGEGYDYEAKETREAIHILKSLVEKEVEEVIE